MKFKQSLQSESVQSKFFFQSEVQLDELDKITKS